MFLQLIEIIEKATWKFNNEKMADKMSKKFNVRFVRNDDKSYTMTECYNAIIQVLPNLLSENFVLTKCKDNMTIEILD